jgi:hypothetical protein
VQRRQAGQESIELAGVSGREHARQPAVRGVSTVSAACTQASPSSATMNVSTARRS